MEEAFRDSQAWLQALFEGVETGIFIIDAEKHRLIDANSVAAEMVGVPREKILGNSCHKFVCPAEHGRCPVTDLGQTVDNSERILLTAKGERRAIIKTVRPMEVSGRTLLLESFLDITDRKQAQEELILKTALLEAQAETTIDGILVVDRT
ncbi:MAG: PAS domain-containing protein, partial [Terracidiphilus sp.]